MKCCLSEWWKVPFWKVPLINVNQWELEHRPPYSSVVPRFKYGKASEMSAMWNILKGAASKVCRTCFFVATHRQAYIPFKLSFMHLCIEKPVLPVCSHLSQKKKKQKNPNKNNIHHLQAVKTEKAELLLTIATSYTLHVAEVTLQAITHIPGTI